MNKDVRDIKHMTHIDEKENHFIELMSKTKNKIYQMSFNYKNPIGV